MYRFILSLILAFTISSQQLYATDTGPINIHGFPPIICEFGLKAKGIIDTLHKKNTHECLELIEKLAAEEASVQTTIDQLFFSHLQTSGVAPTNESLPIPVIYYILSSNKNVEDSCLKAQELKSLIKQLKSYSDAGRKLEALDYRTIVYNLCLNIFAKKMFIMKTVIAQEAQYDHFNYGRSRLMQYELNKLIIHAEMQSNDHMEEVSRNDFIPGLDLARNPHLIEQASHGSTRAIYSVNSFNFTADQYFKGSHERNKVLHMANISTYNSSHRISFLDLTEGWIERYKASLTKPVSSKNKKKKKKGAQNKATLQEPTQTKEEYIEYKGWMTTIIPALEHTFERAGYSAEERNMVLAKFHEVTVNNFGGNLQHIIDTYENKMASLKKEMETLQTTYEKELKAKSGIISKLENLMRSLETEQMPAKDKRIARLEAQKLKANSTLDELKAQLAALQADLDSATKSAQANKKAAQEAEQNALLVGEVRGELAEKTRALKVAEKTEKSLNNKITMLESKEQNQSTLIASQQQELAMREQALQHEMAHRQDLQSKNRALYEAALKLHLSNEKLEADNKTMAEANIQLSADLRAQSKATESLKNALEQKAQPETAEDTNPEENDQDEEIFVAEQFDVE